MVKETKADQQNIIWDGKDVTKETITVISQRNQRFKTRWDICRDSSQEEIYRLGKNGDRELITWYQGKLYMLEVYQQSYLLREHHSTVYRLSRDELGPIYVSRFEIKYKGIWFPCLMVGSDECTYSTIINDPHNLSGLETGRTLREMGIEIKKEQSEGLRIRISKPINELFLDYMEWKLLQDFGKYGAFASTVITAMNSLTHCRVDIHLDLQGTGFKTFHIVQHYERNFRTADYADRDQLLEAIADFADECASLYMPDTQCKETGFKETFLKHLRTKGVLAL